MLAPRPQPTSASIVTDKKHLHAAGRQRTARIRPEDVSMVVSAIAGMLFVSPTESGFTSKFWPPSLTHFRFSSAKESCRFNATAAIVPSGSLHS